MMKPATPAAIPDSAGYVMDLVVLLMLITASIASGWMMRGVFDAVFIWRPLHEAVAEHHELDERRLDVVFALREDFEDLTFADEACSYELENGQIVWRQCWPVPPEFEAAP